MIFEALSESGSASSQLYICRLESWAVSYSSANISISYIYRQRKGGRVAPTLFRLKHCASPPPPPTLPG